MLRAPRAHFAGIEFDLCTEDQLVGDLAKRDDGGRFRYIVTPNTDHIVNLWPQRDGQYTEAFRRAYAAADRRVCDSRIVKLLAQMRGVELTLIPGSDLTARLFREVLTAGDKVVIVGGDETMLRDLQQRFPGPLYVQHIPPMGLLRKPEAIQEIIDFLATQRADFVLLAIGAPQSELVAQKAAQQPGMRGVGLCIGASIEFLLGRKARAPIWMRRMGLEWLHRLLSEPRRLWKRYLVHGPRIFWIALKDRSLDDGV
ncbi:WecB/TagA/CpsF family glycosyltransferase [Sphingobium sp. CR28]|uniref:WecB/TagA/CpsF family glycosyltransferase n=1 Tax=Sphingobium sp. CR28 TaxID=3400272 RepID=UPI003FF11648